jgi:predicted ribosomally synthesized peptide with SipW-like signal peptide
MNHKIEAIATLILIVGLISMATASSISYFNDTETSIGNTIQAGTLDLQIDDANTNVVKVNIQNWRPSSGPYCYTYKLTNIGTLNGYLDISSINVTDIENTYTEPEIEAGDLSADIGELSTLLKTHIFIDATPSNGYFGFEDTTIYNGYLNNIQPSYETNIPIAAGQSIYITIQIGWWLGGNDNLAQSDSTTFDISFQLNQIQ